MNCPSCGYHIRLRVLPLEENLTSVCKRCGHTKKDHTCRYYKCKHEPKDVCHKCTACKEFIG